MARPQWKAWDEPEEEAVFQTLPRPAPGVKTASGTEDRTLIVGEWASR